MWVIDRDVFDQGHLKVEFFGIFLENSISPADLPMFPSHALPASPPPSLVGVTSLVQRGYCCWCPTPLLVCKLVLGAGEVAAGCSATGAGCTLRCMQIFTGVLFWVCVQWSVVDSLPREVGGWAVQMSAAWAPHTHNQGRWNYFYAH